MGKRVLSALIVLLFLWVVSPLLIPLALGAVFAVLFFPSLERLEKYKLSTGVASALITMSVTFLGLLPAAILITLGAKAGVQQLHAWKDAPQVAGENLIDRLLNSPGGHGMIVRMANWFPFEVEELTTTLGDLVKGAGLKLADMMGEGFSHLPGIAMGFAVVVVSIYFFLVDGRKILSFIRQNSPFNQEQTDRLIHSAGGMCRSVILATLISGLAQAILFGLACLVAGMGQAPLIAFLVFLSSFIPLVGSAPITFSIAIYQILVVSPKVGGFLLAIAIAVSLIDNLIRPAVLRGAGHLHPLLAFVAAFGGLQMLGFAGVFLGPVIAGLCMVTIQLAAEHKRRTADQLVNPN